MRGLVESTGESGGWDGLEGSAGRVGGNWGVSS